MSGSSLDGLDICLATFEVSDNQEVLSFSVLQTEAVDFSDAFIKRWRQVPEASAIELARLHADTGRYFGQLTRDFIHRHGLKNIDAVASHGYTVFHQPEAGFTTQIGCGAQLAAQTQCRVITDFRMADVAAGGQGAPSASAALQGSIPRHKPHTRTRAPTQESTGMSTPFSGGFQSTPIQRACGQLLQAHPTAGSRFNGACGAFGSPSRTRRRLPCSCPSGTPCPAPGG